LASLQSAVHSSSYASLQRRAVFQLQTADCKLPTDNGRREWSRTTDLLRVKQAL
jgi:hypothetical protein